MSLSDQLQRGVTSRRRRSTSFSRTSSPVKTQPDIKSRRCRSSSDLFSSSTIVTPTTTGPTPILKRFLARRTSSSSGTDDGSGVSGNTEKIIDLAFRMITTTDDDDDGENGKDEMQRREFLKRLRAREKIVTKSMVHES
jgi:hypothetical protein